MSGWRFSHSVPLSFKPQGISATQDGRLYVGTSDNKVYRLKLDAPHHKLLEEAVFVEALEKPTYVWSSDTVVAVSCWGSHVVRVFDHAGSLLYNIGHPRVSGRGEGELSRPRGVYVDQTGRVFVADINNYRVLVVGAGGVILGRVKTGDQPHSVTVNKDRLFVGFYNGDIITFRLEER